MANKQPSPIACTELPSAVVSACPTGRETGLLSCADGPHPVACVIGAVDSG